MVGNAVGIVSQEVVLLGVPGEAESKRRLLRPLRSCRTYLTGSFGPDTPLPKGTKNGSTSSIPPMQLHLWADSEVEEHLSGNAEIFRRVYFGDLVLTPEDLSRLHEESTAKIIARWQPNLHQVIDAERAIQRMLGQADAWNNLSNLITSLDTGCKAVLSGPERVPGSLEDSTAEVVGLAQSFKLTLEAVLNTLGQGRPRLTG